MVTTMKKIDRVHVGGIIYALRTDRQVGQEKFSMNLGISQGTISKIEHGDLELGLQLFYNILNYFELDSNDFSELVCKYIKLNQKAEKAKSNPHEKKRKISIEIAKYADNLRACHSGHGHKKAA